MRNSIRNAIFACSGALIVSCANTNNRPPSLPQPPPTEEILINNEEFAKPHHILGPVQCTLKTRVTSFTNQIELRERAIDLLKQQTYAKYGDAVDAIIDTKVEENTIEDIEGKLNIINIQGVAISFLAQTSKQERLAYKTQTKRKHKSAKKILIVKKTKPTKKIAGRAVLKQPEKVITKNTKPKPKEIIITPSEILK